MGGVQRKGGVVGRGEGVCTWIEMSVERDRGTDRETDTDGDTQKETERHTETDGERLTETQRV